MSSKKLSIIFQFGGRKYLETITRDWLSESLGEFTDYEWIEQDCTNLTIGQGFNILANKVETEFVLYVQDDWGFLRNGDWVERGMKVLREKDIGFLQLRKDSDGYMGCIIDELRFAEGVPYYTIYTWDNRGFQLHPFMMRTEIFKKLLPLDESENGDYAEASGYGRFKKLGLKTAMLSIPFNGVCFHLGYTRSRYDNWQLNK